jgi:EmrB/QacA subfamily drug resistance transporter
MSNKTHNRGTMHTKELTRKEIILIMTGSMLTLLLAALDNTIVGTAMPKIIRDLHGMEHYSWPFTAYMLCSTVILPISGKLADIYGRKKITLIGIILFVIASVLCGLSRNMIELSVFRGFQGFGGGICISSAFIIVSEIFPPKKRAKYVGLVASMFAVASILGPGAGGVITDNLSWRWVFFVNIPLGLIALFLISEYFPNIIHHDEKRKIDAVGVLVFVSAAFPLLFVISQIGIRSFRSPLMISLSVFSVIMLALFFRVEKKSKEPLLSLHYFREKVFSSSVIAASLGNMAVFGAAIYLPLYLQSVRGASATRSGLIMMPMMVSMILSSNFAGFTASRLVRYKPIALTGIFLSMIGMFCLGVFGNGVPVTGLILFSTLAGIGIGATFPVFMIAPQSIFSPKQVGLITSLVQFFRNLGGTIGSAMFGALMLSHMNNGLKDVSIGNISPETAELIKNPAILSNPVKLAVIRDAVPAAQIADFNAFVSSCLKTVSGSIEIIFTVSAIILMVSLLSIIFFFNEKQVRHSVIEHRKQY